jgi:ACS family hexuronate transporter-like MFS transporter
VSAPVLARRHAWAIALVATLAMSVSYTDRQVVAAIATSVKGALHIDREHFGYLASAFSLAYLVMAPIAGAIVDRVGARRGLVGAVVAWSIVAAAQAIAPGFGVLFALRIALGVAEAPSFPAAAQSVRRALPVSDRSAAFGLVFTGSSIGAAIAGTVAPLLDAQFGWRAAFVATAAMGLLWLPLWSAVTSAPAARDALAKPDAAATTTDDAPPRASLANNAAVLRALLLVLASAPTVMFVLLWFPQYLEEIRHVPKGGTSHFLWLPPLMFDVGALTFGALASRRDVHGRSIAPLVVTAALLASTLALVPCAPGPWTVAFFGGLSMAGGGALYALLTADMIARIHPAHVSTAGGLTAAAQSLTYIVLNPVIGHYADRTHSFDAVLVTLGAIVLPGALAWVAWPVRARRAPSLT